VAGGGGGGGGCIDGFRTIGLRWARVGSATPQSPLTASLEGEIVGDCSRRRTLFATLPPIVDTEGCAADNVDMASAGDGGFIFGRGLGLRLSLVPFLVTSESV
jgi:hypothetical protein